MEFLQAVSGKGDDATIKVGTRSRFHSADGVYNRNQTLRETREAFRQAILSTFGAAGEEALRRMFDGVGAVPLSARTIIKWDHWTEEDEQMIGRECAASAVLARTSA